MDIPSTSGTSFRHYEGDLDRTTQRDDSSDYDDDDDDRLSGEGPSSSGLGTIQSLSISSDRNKAKKSSAMQHNRALSTSSSRSAKVPEKPEKKVRMWEIFPWLLEVEDAARRCLGSVSELKITAVFVEMDFLLKYV